MGDVCKVGDEMPVKVISIDDQDRVKLSRKAALKELGIVDDKVLAGGERPPRDRDRRRSASGDRGGDRDAAGAAMAADRDRDSMQMTEWRA